MDLREYFDDDESEPLEDVKMQGTVPIQYEPTIVKSCKKAAIPRTYYYQKEDSRTNRMGYSEKVKQEATRLLRTKSIAQVQRHFKDRIPYSTIKNWKEKIQAGKKLDFTGKRRQYSPSKKAEVLKMLTKRPIGEVVSLYEDEILKATIYNWASALRKEGKLPPVEKTDPMQLLNLPFP
eukprot:TRINITY_DN3076_c0_g1_i2.p3 TRINITY_DN3076_c0_g1~~TRINITY_DN3076_c0_g1_i2.p3  ORF type:complete len:178 (-),score=14.38 TRINITY_DN3076_c0_g1_i2:187-720(-)